MNLSRSSIAKHAKNPEVKVADIESDNAHLVDKLDQLTQAYYTLEHQVSKSWGDKICSMTKAVIL